MGSKSAGANATELANWAKTPVRGVGNGQVVIAGRITCGASGVVSSWAGAPCVSVVSGPAFSGSAGQYRIYLPPAPARFVTAQFGSASSSGLFAIAAAAPTSAAAYIDIAVHSSGGLAVPSASDTIDVIVVASESRPTK